MLYKSFEVSVKAAADDVKDGGSITAYAATFDREPDSYGDVIAKGAFTDTLKAWKESGNSIPLLFGHRTDDPMMNIGAVTDIKEDDRGLLITASFDPDSDIAQYTRKLVIEKRLTKMSFAYDVEDRGTIELDGMEANELRKLNLYEVSLVPIPANQHAVVVDAKSAPELADDDNVADDINLSDDGDSEPSIGDDTSNSDDDKFKEVLEAIASLADQLTTSFASLEDAVNTITAQLGDEADEPNDEQADGVETGDEPSDEKSASDDSTDETDGDEEDNEEADDGNSEDPTNDESDDDVDDDKKQKKNADIEATLAKMARYQAL